MVFKAKSLNRFQVSVEQCFKAVILTFNKDVSRLAVDLLIDANADKLGPQKSNLLGFELNIQVSNMSKMIFI